MGSKGGKHLIEKQPKKKQRTEKPAVSRHVLKKESSRGAVEPEYVEEQYIAEETEYVYEAPAAGKRTGKSGTAPKQKRRSGKKPFWKRRGFIIAAAAAAVVAIAFGSVYFFIDSKLNKISYDPNRDNPMNTGAEFKVVGDDYELNVEGLEQRESGSSIPTEDVFADENVINILLLGTDMKIPGTNDPGRCDMTMVCSLNRTTGDIKLISFERAIGVPVPGYEDEMLSYVFQYGGGEFMQETINKCFLVDLAGYVHVGYEVFPEVIDAIGGIDVELTEDEVYYMRQYLANDPAAAELKVGQNHLSGTAAYSYCRLRDPDDDWARQGRTREAIAAMVDKLDTLTISDLNKMADKVLPMVNTNLTKSEIRSLMTMAPKFMNAEVSQLMMPKEEETWSYVTGRGAYMLGCDYADCAKYIKEFIYG